MKKIKQLPRQATSFKLKYKFRGKNIYLGQRIQRLPTGKKMHLDIILHPGAVLILPFLTKDKIILLRQYRPVLAKYLYELPAGTLDPGESIVSCGKRELIEETGFAARKIKRLGKIVPIPAYSNEIIYIYQASGLHPETAEKDPDEVISTRIVTRAQIKRLFRRGEIIDAKTICAFCLSGLL